MISDEELEKLADDYWTKTDEEKETSEGAYYTGGQIEIAYKAGYRKCEAMMREKWPSEELQDWAMGWEHTASANKIFAKMEWLRERLFGGGK